MRPALPAQTTIPCAAREQRIAARFAPPTPSPRTKGVAASGEESTEETQEHLEAHTEAIVKSGLRVQEDVDQKDESRSSQKDQDQPMQAGQRNYPSHFPKQHLRKPGVEADLDVKPLYDAPGYKGSGKLEGMVALITGGDSGIGRAVAVPYAREGADIAIIYLCEHADAEETKRAVEKEGRRCLLIAGDVAHRGFCRQAVEMTVAEFGKLDILVNNAAFQEHIADFEEMTEEHLNRTLKTNLHGYFNMAQAAAPRIRRKGSIIMTGSVTGLFGNKHLIDYAMTKGGIHAFARSLSTHLIARNIRVNVVAPGPVWTPLNPADKAGEGVQSFGGDP